MTKKLDVRSLTFEIADALLDGNRRALARVITLIESTRGADRILAESLLERLLPHSGNSFRLGISGVPGVGKSTFIEALGLHIIEEGHRIAVLAVDPSSPKTGGSILGDKTRMETLSRHPDAFIRPSPSRGTLGGVARRTRDVIMLTEAAGFDMVLIETIGVGQSEIAVADLTDMFLLLLAPASGDDLQGIKKGIVEIADLIAVNKADGDLRADAERVKQDYQAALNLLHPPNENQPTRVMSCSSIEGSGVAEIWHAICTFRNQMRESGEMSSRRAAQAATWMWNEISEELLVQLRQDKATESLVLKLERDVIAGRISATAAARCIIKQFPLKPNKQKISS